jgi:hypothetical protein
MDEGKCQADKGGRTAVVCGSVGLSEGRQTPRQARSSEGAFIYRLRAIGSMRRGECAISRLTIPPCSAAIAGFARQVSLHDLIEPLVPLVDGILIDPGRVVARAAGRMTKNRKINVPISIRPDHMR